MMLRYKRATRNTKTNSSPKAIYTHTLNKMEDSFPTLPSIGIPTSAKSDPSLHYRHRRVSLESTANTSNHYNTTSGSTAFISKGKVNKVVESSLPMLYKADGVRIGNTPTQSILPIFPNKSKSKHATIPPKRFIPRFQAAFQTTAPLTPSMRVSIGEPPMTPVSSNTPFIDGNGRNIGHLQGGIANSTSAFHRVSPFKSDHSSSIDKKYIIKTPIISAASALIRMMSQRFKQNEQVPFTLKPLILPSGGVDATMEDGIQDVEPLDQDLSSLSSLGSGDDTIGSISCRNASLVTVHDRTKAIKKKTALKAKKSLKKSTLVGAADGATSGYKRIPSRYLNNPSLHMGNMRLSNPRDKKKVNALHRFVRKELLEVFVLNASGDSQHRVGLRCVHCGNLPKQQRAGTSMAVFFPKSVEDLYRSVCTWQRIHFKACRNMPEHHKQTYWRLKDSDRSRGKKSHWIQSALDMGLRNVDEHRNGIVYSPIIPGNTTGQELINFDESTTKRNAALEEDDESVIDDEDVDLSEEEGHEI